MSSIGTTARCCFVTSTSRPCEIAVNVATRRVYGGFVKCALMLFAIAACSSHHDGGAAADAPIASDGDGGGSAQACATRISYGAAWLAPANHANRYDDVDGEVTWDGTCVDDGANSYAVLSNGFKPYFTGHSACILALDESAGCAAAAPACTTRITYGTGWIAAANHPNSYDDVAGRVFGDDVCHANSYATLSNGFAPHFSGGTCPVSGTS